MSTSYGELTQASVGKMLDTMVQHGLRHDDVFLDVGSGYGRVVAHVALTTGLTCVGIEALRDRHALAKQCIAACYAKALDLSGVELHEGEALANLYLLFSATHVLVFDARFQPETKAILRHLWCHLAGSRLRLLFCIKVRASGISDATASFIEGFQLVNEIDITTGQNNFIMCVYRAILDLPVEVPQMADRTVEVAVLPDGRIGLRARRFVSVGEEVLRVVCQRLSISDWRKLQHEAADLRWQWMLRRQGEWMHVLNVARFANGPDDASQANARYVIREDNLVFLQCSHAIKAGEEVVACCSSEHRGEQDIRTDVMPWH